MYLNYRQRIEMAERLKKEEEERNARRKRVEAIMLRTRGKNQTNTSAKVRKEFYINKIAKLKNNSQYICTGRGRRW